MRRRAKRITVSLFPFLMILMSVMGVLAFIMVSTVVVSAVNPNVRLQVVDEKAGGNSSSKQPIFIECRSREMVVVETRQRVALAQLTDSSSGFGKLLTRAKRNEASEYILVLVRPSGIPCFRLTRQQIKKRKLDLGFELVPENWTMQ